MWSRGPAAGSAREGGGGDNEAFGAGGAHSQAGAPLALCCLHHPWEPHLGPGLQPSTPPCFLQPRGPSLVGTGDGALGSRGLSREEGPLGEPDPGPRAYD